MVFQGPPLPPPSINAPVAIICDQKVDDAIPPSGLTAIRNAAKRANISPIYQDKFETTRQFIARRNRILRSRLGITDLSILIRIAATTTATRPQSPFQSSPITEGYDADKQQIRVSPDIRSCLKPDWTDKGESYGYEKAGVCLLESQPSKIAMYKKAVDIFGRIHNVAMVKTAAYGVFLGTYSQFDPPRSIDAGRFPSDPIVIEASIEEGKKWFSKSKTWYIKIDLLPPFFMTAWDIDQATINNDQQRITSAEYLFAKLKCIGVVDNNTKEIIKEWRYSEDGDN